jgi:hypothetical protein
MKVVFENITQTVFENALIRRLADNDSTLLQVELLSEYGVIGNLLLFSDWGAVVLLFLVVYESVVWAEGCAWWLSLALY